MNLIRSFLWALVGVMTLQGFLHADEYGVATSMIGGISLTMSVWQESLAEGARSWFSSPPKFIPLPRVIVQSALKETALHPGIQVLPKLQQTLKTHQRTWDLFREQEVQWLLRHSDLVGGLLSDPDARAVWSSWKDEEHYAELALEKAQKQVCKVRIMDPGRCDQITGDVEKYEQRLQVAKEASRQWGQVLGMDRWLSAHNWWAAIRPSSLLFQPLADAIARLHDIDNPADARVQQVLDLATETAKEIATNENPWLEQTLTSLLTGEVWSGCLEHVRLREGRIRDLMMVAGIQDMINAHERILNASLRVVSTAEERRKVQDWFGEMSGYAWFLSDELPSLVRRCIGQDAGDCIRIGPTEIVVLTAKAAERSKIVEDWVRRVFIGMWNSMPIVLMLFVFELILVCIPTHWGYYSNGAGGQKTVVLRLESAPGQGTAGQGAIGQGSQLVLTDR